MTSQGYQAPRCADCGHPTGDHRTGRVYGPLRQSSFGACLISSCDCRQFVPEADDPRVNVSGGSFGRMLQSSKEDRDAA